MCTAWKRVLLGPTDNDACWPRRSTIDFYDIGDTNHANGDPRMALAAATQVCTEPEAEDRLLGFFGGISSEESKAVQVKPCHSAPRKFALADQM